VLLHHSFLQKDHSNFSLITVYIIYNIYIYEYMYIYICTPPHMPGHGLGDLLYIYIYIFIYIYTYIYIIFTVRSLKFFIDNYNEKHLLVIIMIGILWRNYVYINICIYNIFIYIICRNIIQILHR
jgi:hypothetical protein